MTAFPITVILLQSGAVPVGATHRHFCPCCYEYEVCEISTCSWYEENVADDGTPLCSPCRCTACEAANVPNP